MTIAGLNPKRTPIDDIEMEAIERHLGLDASENNNAATVDGAVAPCSEDDDDNDVMDDSTEEASSEVVKKPVVRPPPLATGQTTAAQAAAAQAAATAATDDVDEKPLKALISESKEALTEPLYEEDIIDGFSFVSFETYDNLEVGYGKQKYKLEPSNACGVIKVCFSIVNCGGNKELLSATKKALTSRLKGVYVHFN